MKSRFLPVLALYLLASGAIAQQGPDVLVPSGSLDGVYRLVDRDSDGAYLTDGEAYDWLLSNYNSSIRNMVLIPGSTPPRFFYVSAVNEQIHWCEDTNQDGIIDAATEEHVFYDLAGISATTSHEVNCAAIDRAGALWWTNDSGAQEGLYRSVDLNNDGDAEDAGETVGVFVEPTTLTVANAPLSGNPTIPATNLDSLVFDPTWGPNGRFLFEDEFHDATIAMEDIDGDGTFNGTGEVYVFSALYTSATPRSGKTDADVNPDVTAGLLPISNEVRHHAVDNAGGRSIYYLLSADGSAANTDASIVFRGIDRNADGDVNDTGEVTIYWDGSLDSTGATPEYNWIQSIYVYNGQVYIHAEWDATPDHERVLRLDDNNGDGDANDAGETVVLWDFEADRTHYFLSVLPPGLMARPPLGTPGTYNYFGTSDCATSLPGFHNIQVGTDNFNDKPVIGNANFHMRTWGVAPSAVGVYTFGLSDQLFQGVVPLPFPLDPTCVVYASWDIYIPFTADAAGEHNLPLPLPLDPILIGPYTYWQAVALDAGSILGYTVSDAAAIRIGAYSYSVN